MPGATQRPQSSVNRAGVYNTLAIACGVWFLLTGWIWTYLLNLFIAYPVGIAGFFLWRKAKEIDPNDRKGHVAIVLLRCGLVISVVAVFLYK